MTAPRSIRKGDRVQLPPGTVVECAPDITRIILDGGNTPIFVDRHDLAKATILPRELQVGDWVLTDDAEEGSCELLAIRASATSLWCPAESRFLIKPLANLTLDPDHKSETEGES